MWGSGLAWRAWQGVWFLEAGTVGLAPLVVGEVWGVGGRIGAQLHALGSRTVRDLARMDAQVVRQRRSVVSDPTVLELPGVLCLGLYAAPPPSPLIP